MNLFLAIRNYLLNLGDKNEGIIFLEKVRSETECKIIHGYCDELREYLESDTCKFTE